MPSLNNALYFEWHKATPEAKYTYLKLIERQFKLGQLPSGLEALSEETGVNKKTLSKSIGVLFQRQLLTKQQAEPRTFDRGRKSTSITLNPIASSRWNEEDDEIALMLDTCDKYQKKDGQTLQSAQKLLATILVRLSDDFGIVSDITQSQLRAWTGVTSTRLKSILKTLSSIGLIINTIPGLSGAKLFGKKTSIYVLNPRHPLFLKRYPLYTIKLMQFGVGMSLGAEFYSRCYSLRKIPNPNGYSVELFNFYGNVAIPESVLPMFADRPVGASSAYFQEQIDVIVSVLLSQNLLTKKELNEWTLETGLFEQLFLKTPSNSKKEDCASDTQSNIKTEETSEDTDKSPSADALKVEIEKISRMFYTHIKSLLHSVYGDDNQALRHRIVSITQMNTEERLLQIVSIPKREKTISKKIQAENEVTYTSRDGFSIVD